MRSSESTLWMKRVEDGPFESSTEKLDWIPLPPFFRFYSSSRSSLHSSAPLASLHPRMNILRSEFYRVLFKHSISFSMRMQVTEGWCMLMLQVDWSAFMFAWLCLLGLCLVPESWAMLCILHILHQATSGAVFMDPKPCRPSCQRKASFAVCTVGP